MMNSGVENSEGIDSFGESRRMSEYADQLRSWLGQAYQWQCIPYVMPSVLINSQYSPPQQIPTTSTLPNGNVNPQQQGQPNAGVGPVPPSAPNAGNPDPQVVGRIYEVPKLSKRLLAEVIDFGLLFFIKALVTLTVLDSWNLDGASKLSPFLDRDTGLFETEESEDADYELAMALTANLLTIELVHRMLVVFYEVWFTHQGGTPGKRTMGIRILSCTKCLPVGENRILVQPATEVTFWRSLSRAFLKNMGTALLFPTFLPLMVVQHNRTLYDILCGTVVVESE